MKKTLRLSLTLLLLATAGCKLAHPPLLSAIMYPLVQASVDSASPAGFASVISKHQLQLKKLKIGVLKNSKRDNWRPDNSNSLPQPRLNECFALQNFLLDLNCFAEVLIIDEAAMDTVDYSLSCTAECIYNVKLDAPMYFFNSLTFGLGFLAGYPYKDSEATYVVQASFFRYGEHAGTSLASNHRIWLGENLYWRPLFYAADNFEPCFEILFYDFLSQSGCLDQE